ADELGRHVLRQLALTARALGVVVEVVAELRADDQVEMLLQERREDRLPSPVAVGIGGVDVVDSEFDRGANEIPRLLIGVVSPPAGGDGPGAKAEFGEL